MESSWHFLQPVHQSNLKDKQRWKKKSSKAPYPPKDSLIVSSLMFDGWLSYPGSKKFDAFGQKSTPGGGLPKKKRAQSARKATRRRKRKATPRTKTNNRQKKRRKPMSKEEQLTPVKKSYIYPSTPRTLSKTPRITEFFTPHAHNISPLVVRTEPFKRQRPRHLDFGSPQYTLVDGRSLKQNTVPTVAELSRFWRQVEKKNPSTGCKRQREKTIIKENSTTVTNSSMYKSSLKEKSSGSLLKP